MVKSPLWADVRAEFAVLSKGGTAVIEMAQASGLPLVPESERNPLLTTTFGTGQLVRRAVEEGCRRIYVGIGGSATVDGGAGMAAALGVKLLDAEGRGIPPGGGGLSRLSKIDLSDRIDISDLTVVALSDVTNPLLGENGAARVFGPQKGATPEMVAILERNLAHFARVVEKDLGTQVDNIPGAGAAGGLGAGIAAFLGGDIQSGVGALVELVGLREKVRGADLVITGEGKLDRQTGTGKAPMGVAKVASELGVPVVAICGSLGEETPQDVKGSFIAVLSLVEIAGSEERAMRRPAESLKEAVARFCSLCPPPWGKGCSHQCRAGRKNTDISISSLLERLDGVKTESHRNNPGEV
jgi:glycerate kinase